MNAPMSDITGSTGPATSHSISSAKISCLACRAAKRKCHTSDAHARCRRCANHDITCEYTKHRRGRKKKASTASIIKPLEDASIDLATANNVEILGGSVNNSTEIDESLSNDHAPLASISEDEDDHISAKDTLNIHFSHVIPKDGDSSPFIVDEITQYPVPSPGDDPLLLQHLRSGCPDPVKAGLISETDADELFNFYFQHLNAILAILDPRLHTPNYCRRHSALLYTSVLAVTAKVIRPKIYTRCMMLANKFVGQTVEYGLSSVHAVQALNLLHHWKKSDDHTSWRRIGYAIRMGQELRLDIKGARPLPTEEQNAREILNRERAWMNLIIADYHLAIHHSLPRMILTQDVDDPSDWVADHPQLHTPGESSLGPLVTFSRMCRFYADNLRTTNKDSDMRTLSWLELEWARWRGRWLENNGQFRFSQPQLSTFHLCDAYFRFHIAEYRLLAIARHGDPKQKIDLQDPKPLSFAFSNCVDAALGVALVLQSDLAPYGYLPYCFYLTWVALAVTAIWLVKNIAPMSPADRARVIGILSEVQYCTEEASRSSDDMAAYTHRLLKHLLTGISPEWQLASFLVNPTACNTPIRATPEPAPSMSNMDAPIVIPDWEPSSAQEIIQGYLWNQPSTGDMSNQFGMMPTTGFDVSNQQQAHQQSLHLPPHQSVDNIDQNNVTDLLFPAADDDFWKNLFPFAESGTNVISSG
ncbi:uncharacterized protein L201_005240 [Kwoniella dendrophila CBS 6074]|uniref:Zn(2)-C6 fungal-type domain-containing protein n=1 Tax=Kwoniella dendrophila CBS 6074 TaxID=1295534 RepID=A0AAX4JYH1_9TREE